METDIEIRENITFSDVDGSYETDIRIDQKVTFSHAMGLYKEVISVGFPLFSIYALYVENNDKGISLISDFHYRENDFTIRQSEDIKEIDITKIFEKEVTRLKKDIEDSQSDDIFIRDSVRRRYMEEFERLKIKDIADIVIDSMNSYKQAEYIPLIGNRFDWQLPFTANREVRINRKDKIYEVKLMSDSRSDLKKMTDDFYRILAKD